MDDHFCMYANQMEWHVNGNLVQTMPHDTSFLPCLTVFPAVKAEASMKALLNSTDGGGAVMLANLFAIAACFTHGPVTGMQFGEFHGMAGEISSSPKTLNNRVSRMTKFHVPQLL